MNITIAPYILLSLNVVPGLKEFSLSRDYKNVGLWTEHGSKHRKQTLIHDLITHAEVEATVGTELTIDNRLFIASFNSTILLWTSTPSFTSIYNANNEENLQIHCSM